MDSRSGVILICGLGGLGQACLRTLMGFDAEIHCIDQRKPRWVDGVLAERYRRQLTIGDMRSPQTLRLGRAGDARAVLLLSHDSGVNLEAALQVRLLNPRAQLVVRTNSSRSLERQLQQRLPGLATVDPSLLTAGVFANALRTIAEGGVYYPAEIRRLAASAPQPDLPPLVEELTPRELDVAAAVSRGLKNNSIADLLGISLETVKTHVGNAMDKLGARDRTQMAVTALLYGLIDPLDS